MSLDVSRRPTRSNPRRKARPRRQRCADDRVSVRIRRRTGERIPRVAGWYLLQQFHNKQAGRAADWDLTGLQDLFENIEVMNANLPKRLDEPKVEDASRNAVIHLRTFAELFAVSVSEESMQDVIESLFDPEFGTGD